MTVTSLVFFASACLAALVYHRLPARLRLPWLLVISLAFVLTWSWQFALVLVFYSGINYWLGLRAAPANPACKRWVTAGIIINILFLFIFKYNHFFLPQFSSLLSSLGILREGSLLQLLMPVGLSFLMVQNISYLVDVSNNRHSPETSFIRFSVYILYFPKLLSGPVERARVFLPRLVSPLVVDRALVERSAALVLVGLVRKLALADPLFNMIPASAFTSPVNHTGQDLVFWLLAYAFALYNDFAGYTSIVRGVSLWFGIELSPNFNLPYYARNFTEFWSRWHITLSNWLRDYIFYPLAWKLRRRYPAEDHFFNVFLPPMATMLVSGMWHGLSWNLLVWGGLHGLYLMLEHLPSLGKPLPPMNRRPRWKQNAGRVITFLLAALAWLPFRTSLRHTWEYLGAMFRWAPPNLLALARTLVGWSPLSDWSQFNLPNPILILVLAAAIGFDALQHKAGKDEFLLTMPRWFQVLLVVLLLFVALLAFFSDTIAPFVYQGF